MLWDLPAHEGVCVLGIKLDAFFHETLAICAITYSIFEIQVQDLHSYGSAVTGKRMWGISEENLPSVIRMHPSSGYTLCKRHQET